MKEDYHIDLSNRFYDKKTTGIALVGAITKNNKGCGISKRVKRYIEKKLFTKSIYEEYAKLYAICIFFIILEELGKIKKLIICNDEDFIYVKEYLSKLLKLENKKVSFEIINISEYRMILGRNVSSLADNYARIYAKRALKPTRWDCGKEINVVNINYRMIREKWELLNKT